MYLKEVELQSHLFQLIYVSRNDHLAKIAIINSVVLHLKKKKWSI